MAGKLSGALERNDDQRSLKSYSCHLIPFLSSSQGLEPNGHGWEWSSSNALTFRGWELIFPSNSDNGFCGTVTKTSGKALGQSLPCFFHLPYPPF